MKGIKNGFSLIEMVIAIVIIGVLSLPLLAYFSGAAINSSRGSMVQTGEMAAQSIIEEINSYDTYGQLANAAEGAVSGCAFTVDASEPEDGNDYLLRDITVDDVDMTAKIRIDYDYESPDDLNYNTYRVPDLRALYTEQNAVAVEEDQTDLSVNEFYYKHEGTISKANIKRNMTRTGEINIVTNAEDEDLFDISAGYEYQHLSDEPVTFTVLKTQILKEDFRCFYFLYDILSEDAGVNEEFNINFSSDITTDEAKEMSIYFICQKPEGYRIPPGYQITAGFTGSSSYAQYFTSSDEDGVTIPITGPDSKAFYIEGEPQDRIAHITVDLYHIGETVFTEQNRILRMESAK